MTHEELLAKIDEELSTNYADECGNFPIGLKALRAIVELHKPIFEEGGQWCDYCKVKLYPCITIQVIEKELTNGNK